MKNKKNYLLFMPSLMRNNAQPITYCAGNWETSYEGKQTNEALTKYLCHRLALNGEKLEKIFMLCTPEVLSQPVEAAGGKSSYAYYRDQAAAYMVKKCGYSEAEAESVFYPIPYTPGANISHEDAVIREVIERITENAGDENGSLYVDFTGGIRSAAMALVFACRIAEDQGVHVERVLYSNISKEQAGCGMIEDCTHTYNAFRQLEAALRAELGDYDKAIEMRGAFDGADQDAFADQVKQKKELEKKDQFNDFAGQKEAARKAKAAAEKKKDRPMNPLISRQNQGMIQKTEEYLKKDVIPELETIRSGLGRKGNIKDQKAAIKDLRENAVSILWKAGIIQVGDCYLEKKGAKGNAEVSLKDLAERELMGAYRYYTGMKTDKKHFHGVWEAANDLIQAMAKAPDRQPKDIYEQWKQKTASQIWNCFESMDADGYAHGSQFAYSFGHNSFSRRCTHQAVEDFAKKNGLDKGNFAGNAAAYDKVDRLLMNYGYPYFCSYKGSVFAEYKNYYKQRLINLYKRFQKLYDKEPDQGLQKVLAECFGMSGTETYAEVIGRVAAACKQGPVLELFPFIIDGKKIWTDRPDKAEWSRELFEFAGSLDILRKMRNDISHPKAINEKEFQSALQTARRLIAWIDQADRKSSGEQLQQAS